MNRAPPSPRARSSPRSNSSTSGTSTRVRRRCGPVWRPEEESDIDPIEINAGQWYLRGLRADDRIDDRPALAELGITDADHVAHSDDAWAADSRYSWAVCEPTTGELLAEVTLDANSGEITGRVRRGHENSVTAALESVRRFAATILAPECNSR